MYTVKNATDFYTLDGLVKGETYQVVATVVDAGGLRTQPQYSAPFVPGCIMSASSPQCCGHGLCGLGRLTSTSTSTSTSTAVAHCFCNADYHGEFCERRKSDEALDRKSVV